MTSPEEYEYKLHNQLNEILINVTNECNMACTYCVFGDLNNNRRKLSPPYMNPETAKMAVDFLLKNSRESNELKIGFYGGEPLLNLDTIKETVEYAINKNSGNKKLNFYVITNGTLLNSYITKWFIKNNIEILVSLDGPKLMHNRYRIFKNGKGSFNLIMNNLKKIKNNNEGYYKKQISFLMVCAPPFDFKAHNNFCSTNEFITDKFSVKSLKYDEKGYFINIVRSAPEFINSELKFILNQYFHHLKSGLENNKEKAWISSCVCNFGFNKIINRNIFREFDSEILIQICESSQRRCFVTTDGSLFPCEKVSQYSYIEIGNIYKGFYKSPNYHTKGYELKQCFLNKIENDCINCWAHRLCDYKHCYVMAQGKRGFSKIFFSKNCVSYKNELEMKFKLYGNYLKNNT